MLTSILQTPPTLTVFSVPPLKTPDKSRIIPVTSFVVSEVCEVAIEAKGFVSLRDVCQDPKTSDTTKLVTGMILDLSGVFRGETEKTVKVGRSIAERKG